MAEFNKDIEISFEPYILNTYTDIFLNYIKKVFIEGIDKEAKENSNNIYCFNINTKQKELSGYYYDDIKSIKITEISCEFNNIMKDFILHICYDAKISAIHHGEIKNFIMVQRSLSLTGKMEDYYINERDI